MAYPPRPGGFTAASITPQVLRQSVTPPFTQVVSKQKKRRNALAERLNNISVSFAQNRDDNYRKQLQTLQFDIAHINHADPYGDCMLDDFSSDILDEMTTAVAGNLNETLRLSRARKSDMEASPRAGFWSSKYTQEINDAIEHRDTQLTLVGYRHNCKIDDLKRDYEYSVQVAEEERKKLMDQIRDRVVHQVNQKKAILTREKDRLDIGDTNAFLFHPNHFSLHNPASPGGTQNNRKTRHTRHRQDVDELGTLADGNKRKRKAPADADVGSPGPPGRNILADGISTWKELQAKQEAQQMTAPLMSIEELFSEKELNLNLQLASHAAIDAINYKRCKLSQESQGSGTLSNADATDVEDNAGDGTSGAFINPHNATEAENEDVFLTAPEMDRTANSSHHATRSSRTMNLSVPLTSSALPSDLAGRASAIPYIGSYSKERKKEDDYQRAPPLTEQERVADLALMAAAAREEERAPGSMNRKLINDLSPPITDYVGANAAVAAAAMLRGEDAPLSDMRTMIVARTDTFRRRGRGVEETDER